MAPHGKDLVNASIRDYLCKNDFSCLSKAFRKRSKKKVRQSFESTDNSEIFIVSGGGHPIFCLQKGILSPSCLPAFGKFNFHSLYHLIFHCERDFSFVSERDSHFFWQDNITIFFALCQSCKMVSSCRAWSSERPGPGASAGAFALPRCAPQGGGDEGVDEGLIGTLMDGIEWCAFSDSDCPLPDHASVLLGYAYPSLFHRGNWNKPYSLNHP